VLSVADYRDDAMLTTAANNALALNVIVPDGVEATAQDGNVTLTGTVGYGTERAAAERAVSGLIGLRNVRNDIEISYDVEDPVGVDLHVQEALDRSALVPDDSDVEVATKGGIITLTGHVRTWAEPTARQPNPPAMAAMPSPGRSRPGTPGVSSSTANDLRMEYSLLRMTTYTIGSWY
jgi:osmotically-inducible protein OsmY